MDLPTTQTPDRTTSGALVDQETFRQVAGQFTTGVTVITTLDGDRPVGTTASAVASLSMDPPMMLVCLNRSSATHDAMQAAGVFGVNIMARDQTSTALQFARKGPDKFDGVDWSPAGNGAPLIDGSLATIACRTVETATGGTHTVFLAEVAEAHSAPGEPLTYYRGIFGRFDEDDDDKAYAALRHWVLSRRTPVNERLDPQELAIALGFRPGNINKALVRLGAQKLVELTSAGAATVSPINADLAAGFFAAQAAIEVGVIDTSLQGANNDHLARLADAGRQIAALHDSGSTTLEAQLETVKAFHRLLLGLSNSKPLLAAYEEMATTEIWHHALDERQWSQFLDVSAFAVLTDALAARDTATARAAVLQHSQRVADIVHEVISTRGGSI
ncbi:flavin reductase [Arthrobacter sulfonylureivorans]|uniref:Flavin reductase n=1 Tax=Arthrobacter sulfonylureivorans TaxID=2486855 RepID=A0ABY3W715_9MICC|nr:flavin reductase [Arthrobacter sulfonylureivorans]UNK46060.1 flavin reductase [Arthrobacter sulfonylureivorans]